MAVPESKYGYKANRAPAQRLRACQQAAVKRGLECSIALNEYRALLATPCTYCGFPLNETGSGLDRIDPSKGYVSENVVPCCWDCNRAKGSVFTYDEMLVIGSAIARVKRSRLIDIKRFMARLPELKVTSRLLGLSKSPIALGKRQTNA